MPVNNHDFAARRAALRSADALVGPDTCTTVSLDWKKIVELPEVI